MTANPSTRTVTPAPTPKGTQVLEGRAPYMANPGISMALPRCAEGLARGALRAVMGTIPADGKRESLGHGPAKVQHEFSWDGRIPAPIRANRRPSPRLELAEAGRSGPCRRRARRPLRIDPRCSP